MKPRHALLLLILMLALVGAGVALVVGLEADLTLPARQETASAPDPGSPESTDPTAPDRARRERPARTAAGLEAESDPQPARGTRRCTWLIENGEVPIPEDGTEVSLVCSAYPNYEPDGLQLTGVIRDAMLVVDGVPPEGLYNGPPIYGTFLVTTPDGAMGRAGRLPMAEEGPAFSFRRPRSLTVFAHDERRQPAVGIRIATGNILVDGFDDTGPAATTDADGLARFDGLFEDELRLWAVDEASPRGFLLRSATTSPDGVRVDVLVPAVRDAVLRVTAEGAYGLPEGLVVYAEAGPPAALRLEPELGIVRFRIRPANPSRPLRITVGAHGYVAVTDEADAASPGGTFELDVHLVRPVTYEFRARVLGKFDPGWPFPIDRLDDDGTTWRRAVEKLATEDGMVRAVGLTEGTYRLRDQSGASVSEAVAVPSTSGGRPPTLDLRGAAFARGRVEVTQGTVAGPLRLVVEGEGLGWVIGDDGRPGIEVHPELTFVVRLPANQAARVQVWTPQYGRGGHEAVEIQAPSEGHVLRVRPVGVVAFRPDPPTQDGFRMDVLATPRGGGLRAWRTAVVADGVARFGGLVEGAYDLWIDAPGFAPAAVDLPATSKGEVDLGTVQLVPGSSIILRMLLAAGREPPSVSVTATCLNEPSYWRGPVNSAEADSVRMDGLGAGRFRVDLHSVGLREQREVVLDGHTDVTLELDLR